MNTQENLDWGWEISIKKLRPTATFVLASTRIENWNDPSGATPPTWEEIEEQTAKDKAKYDEWEAQRKLAEWGKLQG